MSRVRTVIFVIGVISLILGGRLKQDFRDWGMDRIGFGDFGFLAALGMTEGARRVVRSRIYGIGAYSGWGWWWVWLVRSG